MTPSRSILRRQFLKAQKNGWLLFFADVGKRYRFAPALLLGIASRETNMSNVIGDGGHGYSLMQIDNRSFPEWCASEKWKDVHEAIRMGASVLRSKYSRATVRKIDKANLLRVAVASYNAGDHAIDDYLRTGNPDRRTTGHDYSRDVLARTEIFRSFLA